jgi:predicted enzyme related to lactoylglutathione lyase
MQATKVMAHLHVADIDAAKRFYAGYLGLTTEEFNLGWVARLTSADSKAVVQLVTRDATARTRSFPSAPTTSTVRTQKPGNSATRSCIR